MQFWQSIACYRGGLAISPTPDPLAIAVALSEVARRYLLAPHKPLRLADKALNDWIVCATCEIAGQFNKPGEL